ncbi:mechanosensitive ion channel [Myxococcota bacterium]|nr:mechanosensitive ion channel [Myxococcota bacterium]MBU1537775.1 mechanosensitive ion channel [Myxococcota bacterium]
MNASQFKFYIQNMGTTFGLRIISAIAIYISGRILLGFITKTLERFLAKKNLENTISRFIVIVVRTIIRVIVFLAILAQIGIQTTSFIAILGAASFAIGLALQGALSNFAAGVLLIIFRPFRVGDTVSCAGITGKISVISILATHFITRDNKKIIVPNSRVMSETITNMTVMGQMTVDLILCVPYEQNLSHVRDVLTSEVLQHPLVLKDRGAYITVESLDAAGVQVAVRPWCECANYWMVRADLLESIKNRFELEQIPFH